MKKREIGNTGVHVTPVTFGTSAIGSMPDTYGYGVDEERARATLNAIMDGPVNVIDTSNNYGFGRSEERMGTAFTARGGVPADTVISTKVDRAEGTDKFDADQVHRSFEQSLNRMGVERVGILYLHDPEYAADLSEVTREGGGMDAVFKLKEEGLCDAVGLAMGKTVLQFELLKDWPFDTMISHNRMTLLNRNAQDMFDYAHARGIAIMNAAPYAGGVLAKGSDQVKSISYTQVDDAALEPVRRIEEIAAKYNVGTGALALQFSMRDPRITSTICGVSRPERVAQTIEWANAAVPEAAWEELAGLSYETEDPEAMREYKLG